MFQVKIIKLLDLVMRFLKKRFVKPMISLHLPISSNYKSSSKEDGKTKVIFTKKKKNYAKIYYKVNEQIKKLIQP